MDKSNVFLFLSAISVFAISCTKDDNSIVNGNNCIDDGKSIVILYENDVHCNIDGYVILAGYRDIVEAPDSSFVGIVSSGDYLNGDVMGVFSRGQYVVSSMRNVGYDAITLGNHEFDFGVPRLLEVMSNVNAPITCTNFFAAGSDKPLYTPYVIKQYGSKKIAYVGVCTPETMQAERYSFYDKEGNMTYEIKKKEMISLVQNAVDDARNKGADYVVVLSHLGEQDKGYGTSQSLIAATRGIDVLLDGHTHSVKESEYFSNVDNKPVLVSQTGTQFQYIGKLLIKNNKFYTSLVPTKNLNVINQVVKTSVDSIYNIVITTTQRVVGSSDFALSTTDENGKLRTRNGETNIGNLVSDAFRVSMKADIGLINGGGIRNSISAGTINYGQCISALPFYNLACRLSVSGKQIISYLDKVVTFYPTNTGQFPSFSALKFTLHTKSKTIDNIQVLNGTSNLYEAIDPNAFYTLGTSDYGYTGGFFGVFDTAKIELSTNIPLYDILSDYIENSLKGVIGDEYRTPQERVTFVDD